MHDVPGQFKRIIRNTSITRKKDKMYLEQRRHSDNPTAVITTTNKNQHSESFVKERKEDHHYSTSIKSCKILSYASSKLNKEFNTITNIIAERIISKEMELNDVKKRNNASHDMSKSYDDDLHLRKLGDNFKVKLNDDLKFDCDKDFQLHIPQKNISKYKLPFQVSNRKSTLRAHVKHTAVQAELKHATDNSSMSIQTNDIPMQNSSAQAGFNRSLSHTPAQTSLTNRSNVETNTVEIQALNNYTNKETPDLDIIGDGKFCEYMTDSDIYCLKWVKDYLFQFDIDTSKIVLDHRIRDVSEIGVKSSMLSSISHLF